MMLATNWGVYEICERHAQFIDPADDRNMEIRARSDAHLEALRRHSHAPLSPTFALIDVADFPYRIFITRADLGLLLQWLASEIDYTQFKKDAQDAKLHTLLSRFWTMWLDAYPKGSSYTKLQRKGGRR